MANEPKTPQEIDQEIDSLKRASQVDTERIKTLEDRKRILTEISDILKKEELPSLQKSLENNRALLGIEEDKKKKKELQAKIAKDEYELAQKAFLQKKLSGQLTEKQIKEEEEIFKKKKEEYELALKQQEIEQKSLNLKEKAAGLLNGALSTGWNRLVGFAQDFFTEALEVNRQLAQFGKEDLLKSYDPATSGLKQFGIGMREFAQSKMALDKSISSFQNLAPAVQDDLAGMAAKYQNLGVSVEGTGMMLQNFNRGLGMSAKESAKQFDSIGIAAKQAGVNPQKAFAELGSAFGQLSANGAKTGKIFIELMKQSKELGIEVNSMLNIVGKSFDTFEGAADKAGKLNAILGGDYLNSVEMLNATEEQRVELLRQSFQQSGKNYDDLDRFAKKSIVATMGFKDEAEARMMLGRVSVEERLRMKSEKQAQEELTKAQQNSADAMRKIQLAFYDLMTAMRPLANMFVSLSNFMSEHGRIVSFLVISLFLGIAAFKTFSAIQEFMAMRAILTGQAFSGLAAGVTTSTATTTAATQALATSAENMGASIGRGGQKAAPAIPIIVAVGAAIALIGIGIGAAAFGISYLADSFAKLNPEQIKGFNEALVTLGLSFTAFVITMAVLAGTGVALTAATGIAAVGGALLLIGGAVAIAAAGLGFMAGKFAEMFKEITKEKVGLLGDIAIGFAKIAGAMTFSFGGIGDAVKLMKDLRAAIEEIPVKEDFKARIEILKTVGGTLETVKTIKPEQIKPAKDFIDSSKQFYQAQATSKSADQDALVQALKQIIKPEQQTISSAQKETQVILKVDGKSLRAVLLGNPLVADQK